MNKLILVTAFYPDLISKFKNQTFVVVTENPEKIQDIYSTVNDHNGLFCIELESGGVLSCVPFHESWKGIPIFINCQGLGNFKDFLKIKPLLAQLNCKILFSSEVKENFTSVKILSSLGINAGIRMGVPYHWDLLSDLQVYAAYSKTPHAPIEPFHFVMEHYDPKKPMNLETLYFNDPEKFIYIDEDENIALSREKLEKGDYLGKGLQDLDHISENPKYIESVKSWQEYFMQTDGCAYCRAWRMCMGKYPDQRENEWACEAFFSDLIETVEDYQQSKKISR